MQTILSRFALSACVAGIVGVAGAQTYGNTTPFEVSSNHSANYVLGVQVVIPTAIVLQSFGVIYGLPSAGDPSDSNARYGLYSSNPSGGLPLNLIAVTNPVLLTSAQTYDNIAFTSTPTIAAGTYWMMSQYESFANPRMGVAGQSGSLVAYWSETYSNGMPSSSPGTVTTYTGQNFNYWVNGSPVPEPASLIALGLGGLAFLRRHRR